MNDAEFDRHARHYQHVHAWNIAISGETPAYFASYKMRDFARLYAKADLPTAGRVLDFGSGIGASVAPFRQYLPDARLTCADVSSQSLTVLREQYFDQGIAITLVDGLSLPFEDGHFDAAFSCCVFHHIPHNDHPTVLRELRRVVRPNGLVMVYEHNPYNPLTVRAVRTCPLDERAVLVRPAAMRRRCLSAGFASVTVDFRVFFPAALSVLRGLENYLRWLPLGAQYYVAART
jgi:SAM-dependent methyltransferase